MADQINIDSQEELPNDVAKFLEEGKCKEALLLVQNHQFDHYIVEGSSWELVPIVANYLIQENIEISSEQVQCCEELLEEISRRGHPEELLLEFFDIVENKKAKHLFLTVLSYMQTCLKRKVIRGNFLEFCLNAIEYYIVNQHFAEETIAESKDKKPPTNDLSHIYLIAARKFYEPFINEISIKQNNPADNQTLICVEKERKSVICFLFQLLGKSLIAENLTSTNSKSNIRQIAEHCIYDLLCLTSNLLVFLEYAELREINERRAALENPVVDENYCDVYLLEHKVPTISIGVLYYLIYGEEVYWSKIPCIYNTLYVMQISLYLATKLISDSDDNIVLKGLKLANNVLSRIEDQGIPSGMLDSATNHRFVDTVSTVAIYCNIFEQRQRALKVLQTFVDKFDMRGRYLILCNLQQCITHPGLIAVLITQFKDTMRTAMSMTPVPVFFCGKSLIALLKLYFYVPQPKDTNVVEFSDPIVAWLNLLWFLIVADKNNVTGIRDHLKSFDIWFLEPLRNEIDCAYNDNKIDLEELLENKSGQCKPDASDFVEVSVGGMQLDTPEEGSDIEAEKRKAYAVFNALDMMSNLLFRLKETIQYSCLQIN